MILLSLAAMAAPDHLASTLYAGHSITDLALSSDGELLSFTNGTGELYVVDVNAWATDSVVTGCTATAGAAVAYYSGAWRAYTGCDDGRIIVATMDAYARLDSAADFATVDSGGAVLAVETDDSYVYAVYDDGSGGLAVSAFSIADGLEFTDYYPAYLSFSTVNDTAYADGSLFLSHGNDDVTKLTTNSGQYISPSESLGGRDFADLWAYSSGTVYVADLTGSIIKFSSSSNDLSIALDDVSTEVDGVTGQGDEGWMMIATPDKVLQYGFSSTPSSEEGSIDLAGVGEMIGIPGYAIGATADGLAILTDRPWVDGVTLDPVLVGTGAEVTISFTPDMDGTWSVNHGTSEVLASGTAVAGEQATATFVVSSDFDQGDHRIYVDLTSNGLTGVGSAVLSVNDPPDQITLTQEDVLPGNGSIHIDLDALDSDVTEVDVYLVDSEWDPTQFASGGPGYSGPDGLENPQSVLITAGVTNEVVVSGLTNGTTYYVGARARDSSGLEGPMSDVIPVTPQETYTLLDYYNDETPFCGVVSGRAGWLGLAAGALLALRRRSTLGAALVGAALMASSGRAEAREPDLTPRKWDLEVRYGAIINQNDEYLKSAFGESDNSMLRIDYGWCSNLLELDFGTGINHDSGVLLMKDGSTSGDKTFFTQIPLELSVTGRLDFLDEQPLVPFARIGGGYSLFIQDWQADPSADEYESRAGGRFGWFWGAGVMFLLDGLDRGAASALEASTGINDTYIVAEYRSNYSFSSGDDVDLSQTDLTFGLKFDF